jgi:Protein of unknown function (DUF3455)
MRTRGLALLALTFTLASPLGCKRSGGGSSGGSLAPPDNLPKSLAVPDANDVVLLRAYAKGVQVYSCDPSDAGTAHAWTFRAPEAELFSDEARTAKIGTHFAGPTWAHADGSSVVAGTAAKETVDPSAIPWLLLKATSTSGVGVLSKARFVQRVDTEGGLPPAGGCEGSKAGAKVSVPYKAVYLFYGARS